MPAPLECSPDCLKLREQVQTITRTKPVCQVQAGMKELGLTYAFVFSMNVESIGLNIAPGSCDVDDIFSFIEAVPSHAIYATGNVLGSQTAFGPSPTPDIMRLTRRDQKCEEVCSVIVPCIVILV